MKLKSNLSVKDLERMLSTDLDGEGTHRTRQHFGKVGGLLVSNIGEPIEYANFIHKGFMTDHDVCQIDSTVMSYYLDDFKIEPPSAPCKPCTVFLYRKGMTYQLSRNQSLTIDEIGRVHFASGNRHLLLLSAGRRDDIRHPARILRELLIGKTFSRKTRMHGGAAVFPEGACLIIGKKGAGKTTLLTALLGENISFCANDRLIVGKEQANDPNLHVYGLPVTIRVGRGTMENDGRLADFLRKTDRDQLEYADVNTANAKDDKLEFTPAEFCELLRCPIQGTAPLRAVVVPELVNGDRGTQFLPVSEKEKMDLLECNMLEPDPAFPVYFDEKQPETCTEILNDMASLPWVKVKGSLKTDGLGELVRKKVLG